MLLLQRLRFQDLYFPQPAYICKPIILNQYLKDVQNKNMWRIKIN